MRITKDPERKKAMKNVIQRVLEGRTDSKILSKTAQFAFDRLSMVEGSDNSIRDTLRKDFNDLVTKDLDDVVDSLLDIGHRYSEGNEKRDSSRDSRSYSGSRSPSSSRSRSRSASYSPSTSRSRSRSRRRSRSYSDRRRRYRSRSRSNDNRRKQSWGHNQQYDNRRRGNQNYRNRNGQGSRGYGPSGDQYMNDMIQKLMDIVSKTPNTQNQTSLSKLVTENTEPKENLENCIKVDHLIGKNRDILMLSNYFKRFGTICGVRLVESQSAIVQFSSADEAREALKSDVPIFNDRLIEVHACSSDLLNAPADKTETGETASASGMAGEAEKPATDEMDKKLNLIHQRQMQKLQELECYRRNIAKRLGLLQQYVSLWERSRDESRVPHEKQIVNVSMQIFKDARDVYHLVKTGVEKVEVAEKKEGGEDGGENGETGETGEKENLLDNGERAKNELMSFLDKVREIVKPTSVFEEINSKADDVIKEMLDESAREMQIQQNAMRSYYRGRGRSRGRGFYRGRGTRRPPRPRVDTSKYQLDFRPNIIYVKGLDGATEADVREGLKNYPGVRSVRVGDDEAVVIFEQHWQTNKPIRQGVNVKGKLITPELSQDSYVPPPPLPSDSAASLSQETTESSM